jgi:hypothetical protein
VKKERKERCVESPGDKKRGNEPIGRLKVRQKREKNKG